MSAFYKELKRNGLSLSDIRYVLATHYHPDHIGLIGQLVALGVKLLLVDKQKDHIRFSDAIFEKTNVCYKPISESDATVISCAGSRDFLADIGIKGEIIATESHSQTELRLSLMTATALSETSSRVSLSAVMRRDRHLKKTGKR